MKHSYFISIILCWDSFLFSFYSACIDLEDEEETVLVTGLWYCSNCNREWIQSTSKKSGTGRKHTIWAIFLILWKPIQNSAICFCLTNHTVLSCLLITDCKSQEIVSSKLKSTFWEIPLLLVYNFLILIEVYQKIIKEMMFKRLQTTAPEPFLFFLLFCDSWILVFKVLACKHRLTLW